MLAFVTSARGDKDHWLFSHFSGLRQPSTRGIEVWGNIFETRACIFGGFPPFLVVYSCSGTNTVSFPLPLPEPCMRFSLWDSLLSPQISIETTLGGCNRKGGVEAGVSPWWTSRTFSHVTLLVPSLLPILQSRNKAQPVPLSLPSTIPAFARVFLNMVLCRNLWLKLRVACSH